MIKKYNQGFTLIELLVVIAIIGILSSVVLASLNTARAKGSNAAIKSNFNNIRAQAEIYYDGTGANTYGAAGVGSVTNAGAWTGGTGVCSTATDNIQRGVAAAAATAGVTAYCNVSTSGAGWAAYTTLKASETCSAGTCTGWCVDSTGVSKGQTAANMTTLSTTGTACQ